MISIIHGENLVASRSKLQKLILYAKAKGTQEILSLNAEKLDLTSLKQAVESKSLFGFEKMVVIENLLASTKSKAKQEMIDYLIREKINLDLILWENKLLSAAVLKKFSDAQIFTFKISPKIFKFLDSLSPGNHKSMLLFLIDSKSLDAPEMIFYMLHRRVSELIIAKDLGKNGFSHLPAWRSQKLIFQANKFKLDHLLNLHHKFFNLDLQVKSSKSPLALSSMLDLIVSEI